MNTMDGTLINALQEILADLRSNGFQFPLTFSMKAANGSSCLGRYDAVPGSNDPDATFLHSDIVDGQFTLPITIEFTDANHRGATSTITDKLVNLD